MKKPTEKQITVAGVGTVDQSIEGDGYTARVILTYDLSKVPSRQSIRDALLLSGWAMHRVASVLAHIRQLFEQKPNPRAVVAKPPRAGDVVPCPSCNWGGEYERSPDPDPCPTCGGEGWGVFWRARVVR